MTITAQTGLAGVAGSPVRHSLSPIMMNAWLKAAKIDARYLAFDVSEAKAEQAFRALPLLGIAGLNVTAPLKKAALDVADEASAAALAIGAANLLIVRKDKLYADNTDALGFLTACRENGIALNRGPVLVLGAGGAARAILHALSRSGIANIRLANRSPDRARSILALAPVATLIPWSDRQAAARDAGVIINTARAHDGDETLIDWTDLYGSPQAIDINYGEGRGRFLEGAEARTFKTLDGLAMLIGQARPSFEALFGIKPPAKTDIEALLRRVLAQ